MSTGEQPVNCVCDTRKFIQTHFLFKNIGKVFLKKSNFKGYFKKAVISGYYKCFTS